MPIGREGIFISYNKNTIAYYKVYAPNIYTIIISSNIKFFKDLPGSSIKNYQLQTEPYKGEFKKLKGNYSYYIIRNRRGRQKGQKKDNSYLKLLLTINSIYREQIKLLPTLVVTSAP